MPKSDVVPPGSSFAARHEDGLKEMARSEQVAAAVALKQAGFKVGITNRGALVEAVATDVPAATKLDSGDVIVTARGRPVLQAARGQSRAEVSGGAVAGDGWKRAGAASQSAAAGGAAAHGFRSAAEGHRRP